jgi:hypothetical protein
MDAIKTAQSNCLYNLLITCGLKNRCVYSHDGNHKSTYYVLGNIIYTAKSAGLTSSTDLETMSFAEQFALLEQIFVASFAKMDLIETVLLFNRFRDIIQVNASNWITAFTIEYSGRAYRFDQILSAMLYTGAIRWNQIPQTVRKFSYTITDNKTGLKNEFILMTLPAIRRHDPSNDKLITCPSSINFSTFVDGEMSTSFEDAAYALGIEIIHSTVDQLLTHSDDEDSIHSDDHSVHSDEEDADLVRVLELSKAEAASIEAFTSIIKSPTPSVEWSDDGTSPPS